MTDPVPTKKRRYPRATPPKPMLVAWRSPARTNIARISSVGQGGLFIHEVDPPEAGALVQLLFETPNGQVRARAIVRMAVVGRGMGVEFTQMRQEQRAQLARMIKQLLD